MSNDFFKHGDKGYVENLNDGLLVGNAFTWTLLVGLPVDTGGVFPNSSTVGKAKVCDVSATPNSNLSIGSTISNNSGSEQVYRLTVYPNFNRFGGFTSVSVTGDADLFIANKGASSPIVDNLDYSDLGNVPELKVLKEYDIVVTIPSGGEVTGLSFTLQSKSSGISASISQSNVAGLSSSFQVVDERLQTIVNDLDTVGNKVVDITYADNPHLNLTYNTQETQTLGYAVVRNNFCQLYLQTLVSPNQTMQTGNTYTIIGLGNWDIASKQVRVSKVMHTRSGKRFFLDIIPTTIDISGRVDIIPIEEISGGDYLYISETYLV